MATILGVFLTIYALINSKTLKEESAHTREILARIEQGQAEARKEMAEARKEMAEALKYIAQLIVSEAEKTRQVVQASSAER
ncbi:MAG: hypothetical protein HY709_05360 [Candidatus Latescibacteria bacterium]|nr:hypothetical protein [Candidatus Latescibacterota bacterium]